MVLAKGRFFQHRSRKKMQSKKGNDSNNLKDKGNEQKMLWARWEGKVSTDGARVLERRTFGRVPLLHQTR